MHGVVRLRFTRLCLRSLLFLSLAGASLTEAAAKSDSGDLFTITVKVPPKVIGTPASVPLSFTVTDVKRSHRTITLTNTLEDASGRIVWSTKGRRIGFSKERVMGVTFAMDLPALPPGAYTLVSQIPDAVPPEAPKGPATPFDAEPAGVSEPTPPPPPITVRTPLAIEERSAQPTEVAALVISAPDRLTAAQTSFCATVTVAQARAACTAAVLAVEFADDADRVFWRTRLPLHIGATAPAVAPIIVTVPPLPAGQYFMNAWLEDTVGQRLSAPLPPIETVLRRAINEADASEPGLPASAIRFPVARMERFDYDRDLLWASWEGGKDTTPAETEGMKQAGINTGRQKNYHQRYRWLVDHSPLRSPGVWAEDALQHRKEAGLASYEQWLEWIRNDPGFVVMDMYDELGWSQSDDPDRKRLTQLIYWRNRDQPGVATLSRFNALMETDALGWDEILRPGFPEASGDNAIRLKWAFKSGTAELIRMRMGIVRELNPWAQLTPGMGAGLLDDFYDSMHNRAYNKYSTVSILGYFIAGIPCYGTRPWGWLINLKPPFEQCSRITWAALAAAGRFFPVYCPGDGYGDRIVDRDGRLTPSGTMLKTVHDRIQPNAPILLAVRNHLSKDVLYWAPGWSSMENGLFEGLLACGIQPDCGTNVTGRKLIVMQKSSRTQGSDSVRPAAEAGAIVVMTTAAADAALAAFGITAAQPTAGGKEDATTAPTPFDMRTLKNVLPSVAGGPINLRPGRGVIVSHDSPLKPIQSGDQTLAWAGPVGQGWALCFNGDLPLDRRANAHLMRAVLEYAGVPLPFQFTDGSGEPDPDVLGAMVETPDGSQRYLIVVSEAARAVHTRLRPGAGVNTVRDLCSGASLPWAEDGAGRYVAVDLAQGVGTFLALLPEAVAGGLKIEAPETVADGETLRLTVTRLDADGRAVRAAHTIRMRVAAADGQELPALTRWSTGTGPVRLSAPIALNDPPGAWTVEVDDLTDGHREQVRVTHISRPANASGHPDTNAGLPPSPSTPPLAVTVEALPEQDGDLMLLPVRGQVLTALPACPEVTVSLGADTADLLEGSLRKTLTPDPGKPASFEFVLCVSRERAQALRGGRNEGIPITVTASGQAPVETRWTVPVSPYARAPHPIGTLTGGTVALRVNNLTARSQTVALAFDPPPGWAGGPCRATRSIPPSGSASFSWEVRWDDPTRLDPGYTWQPLSATVDGTVHPAGRVFLEQDLEQRWRVGAHEIRIGDDTDAWRPDAVFALTPAEMEAQGWRQVVIGTVLDWNRLAAERGGAGRGVLVAATHVHAPTARQVRLGYTGPAAPAGVWVNGEPVDMQWERSTKTGGLLKQTVPLKAGANTLVVEAPAALKADAATSIVIQEVTTGKRDRSLRITL